MTKEQNESFNWEISSSSPYKADQILFDLLWKEIFAKTNERLQQEAVEKLNAFMKLIFVFQEYMHFE